ncbi:MAG TPA: FecR domain-containing protein [Puia sp.]|jgi:ferric-dicitrate binding protein FerR (iron transport regulator)
MEVTNSLIRKFFSNQCNEEEFEAVMKYFQLHPELLAKEMGLKEWEAGETVTAEAAGEEEVLAQLKERFFPKRVRRMYWPAVAASLLLAVGGWVVINKTRGKGPVAVGENSPVGQGAEKANWTYRTNNSSKAETIVLPDGSRVKLYAHSTLRYTDSFGLARRDSWLAGEAEFSVKKDKAHPFTVLSSSLATTALGTEFGVKSSFRETVKLYSGKVVVRSVRPMKGWEKDVYLEPGQQVLYDDRRLMATVSRFDGKAPGSDAAGVTGQDLVFNNSPLKEVFQQLSIQYYTKFNFRAKDLRGLNFTGTVPRTDSLDVFLRLLAGMNNLEIAGRSGGYTVSRHRD